MHPMRYAFWKISTILCTENKIPSEYYMSNKIYKLGNTSGLHFWLTYIKTEWETEIFCKNTRFDEVFTKLWVYDKNIGQETL